MKTTRQNTRTLVNDEAADARVASFFSISAILTVVLIVVWSLAPPADVGIAEGQLVPDIVGEGHANGDWNDFRLYDYINHSWTEGDTGQYIFLQFMDSDCGHCWSDAAEMSENYAAYGSNGAVIFVTVSVGMLATDHSRAEIVAFQEKGDFMGCYQDKNCDQRPGTPHDWVYVDDLNQNAFQDYNLRGVPFHLLMSPDGVVVWNSGAHEQGDPLHEAGAAIQHHVVGGA